MSKKTVLFLFVFTTIALLLFGCKTSKVSIIYVDVDAAPGGDGTAWKSAFKDIQDALDKAVTGSEIWVAAGKYKPTIQIGGSGERNKSFQMKIGIALYGGFTGSETSRDQRDWKTNKTFLSGDLNDDDVGFTNNDENSFHVLIGDNTDSTSILDGFIVTAGNANAPGWPDDGGGGMSNHEGSPTIRNCVFKGNAAFADGGGMRNWGENNAVIWNCIFDGNKASQEERYC